MHTHTQFFPWRSSCFTYFQAFCAFWVHIKKKQNDFSQICFCHWQFHPKEFPFSVWEEVLEIAQGNFLNLKAWIQEDFKDMFSLKKMKLMNYNRVLENWFVNWTSVCVSTRILWNLHGCKDKYNFLKGIPGFRRLPFSDVENIIGDMQAIPEYPMVSLKQPPFISPTWEFWRFFT